MIIPNARNKLTSIPDGKALFCLSSVSNVKNNELRETSSDVVVSKRLFRERTRRQRKRAIAPKYTRNQKAQIYQTQTLFSLKREEKETHTHKQKRVYASGSRFSRED